MHGLLPQATADSHQFVATTTTTTTVPATATATKNICVPGPIDGRQVYLGIQGPEDYGIASRTNSGPQYTFGQFIYPDREDNFYFHMISGLLQAYQMDANQGSSQIPLANNFLYVQDGVNGGQAYIGDLNTINSNGYYRVPCTATVTPNSTPGAEYDITCYNTNGVPFSTAAQGTELGSLYYFPGSIPSGYVGVQQRLNTF